MMDLGATCCTRSKPDCGNCPINSSCLAYAGSLQTEFPNKKPKKKTPEKSTIMVIPRINKTVLLEKRAPTGIWGGLWCFKEIAEKAQLPELLTKLNLSAAGTNSDVWLTPFRHTFSHYHLDITPVIVDCEELPANEIQQNPKQQWYNLNTEASVGLAASTLKLITLLRDV